MSRCYSALENPLINGFQHINYKDANNLCGYDKSFNYLTNRFQRSQSEDFTKFNRVETSLYYMGRAVRFAVSIPGAIIDLILQLFQSIATTFEVLAVKLESIARGKHPIDTYLFDLFMNNQRSPGSWIMKIRNLTTVSEITFLLRDLHLIKDEEKIMSFSSQYREKLFDAFIIQE